MSVKDTLKKKVAPVMAAAALLTPVAAQASEQNAPESKEQTIEYKIEQGKAEQLVKFDPIIEKFAPEMAKNARKLADKIDAKNVSVYYCDNGWVQIESTFDNDEYKRIVLDAAGNEIKNPPVMLEQKMEGIKVSFFEGGQYSISLNDKTLKGTLIDGNLNTDEVSSLHAHVRSINEKPKELDPVDLGKAQMLTHFMPLFRGIAPEVAKQTSKWVDKYDAFKRCGDEDGDAKNVSILFRKDGYIQITNKDPGHGTTASRTDGKVSGNFVILDKDGNEVNNVMPEMGAVEGIQVSLNKDGKYKIDEMVNLKDGPFIQPLFEGKLDSLDHAQNAIENIGQKAEDIVKIVRDGVLGR